MSTTDEAEVRRLATMGRRILHTGPVILNGSRDISFTMDLVGRDLALFGALADRCGVPVELSPLLGDVFGDAQARYGPREWSPNVIRRLEDATGLDVRAPGFPAQLVDREPEAPGHEVVVRTGPGGAGTAPPSIRASTCRPSRHPASRGRSRRRR